MAKSIIPSVKNNVKRNPPATVYLKGWLFKQNHGKSKAFHKRYFILYGEELRYYKNQNDTTALAIISLDHYTLIPDPLLPKQKRSKSLTFCLRSDDESKYDWPDYFLQADSEEEKQIWVDCLQKLTTCSSTSVLDKWLQRLDMPTTTPKIYQESNSSLPTLSQKTNNNDDDDDDYDEKSSIASSILLTPPNHFYNQINNKSFLKSHKSYESLRAFKQTQESYNKRRPSDISCTKSDSSSKRLFPCKLFSWSSRQARSSSSIASMPSCDEYDDSTSFHGPFSPNITTTTTTTITSIFNHNDSHTHTQKALESHIIHPSEYNQEPETIKTNIRC